MALLAFVTEGGMPALHAAVCNSACRLHADHRCKQTAGRHFSADARHCKHYLSPYKRRKLSLYSEAIAEGQVGRWLDVPAEKLLVKEVASQGLKTIKRIAKGQAILSIPSDKWISIGTVQQSDIGPSVRDQQPWVQLAVFLMYERADPSSRWRGYLSNLPTSVETPLCWEDSELEDLLSGTRLLDSVQGYRDIFENKFGELEANLFEGNRDLFSQDVFNRENFLQTVAVMRARVHPPLDADMIALVPLADQVGHQRGKGAEWKLTPGGFGRGGKALVLEAERDFEAGETVTTDFGPDKLDGDILLNYGVIDDFVTRGGFALNLELPQEDEFFDDKADILDINGLSESFEFVLTSSEEPEPELLAFLRLINLSGQDAFLLESLFRDEAWGFLLRPVSLENETAVFTSMIEGCRGALEDYGKSIGEAKASLKASEPGSRTEKAMRISIGEQEALRSTLQFFEERVKKLDSLEYYQERRLKGLGLLDEDGGSTFDSFFKDGIA